VLDFMVVSEGLLGATRLGATRLAPSASPPALLATINLACGQIVEPSTSAF
jgi:hypothetical protein